jgi:hypothetical protein
MHIYPRHVFENSYETPFFHYAFFAKRNTKCCLPYDNIVVEEEEE